MAMLIFTVLNGMGVAFLLYVLVNFWKEGKRAKHPAARSYRSLSLDSAKSEVFVATRPLTFETDRSTEHPVIRFHAQKGRPQEKQVARNSVEGAKKMPIRRFPSR
jgi:hypothetical protein